LFPPLPFERQAEMVVVVGQARIQRDRHGGLPGTLDRVPELVQRIAQQAVDVRWRRGPLEEVPVDALGRPDLAATVQQRAGQQQLVRIPVVRRRGIAEAGDPVERRGQIGFAVAIEMGGDTHDQISLRGGKSVQGDVDGWRVSRVESGMQCFHQSGRRLASLRAMNGF
jgi:hypothetical protein